MSVQHTAGPWHRNIKPAAKYPTIFAGRNTHVARVVTLGIGLSEVEANANLIAAAPELLKAAELILKGYGVKFEDAAVRGLLADAVARANGAAAPHAIAKATGAAQ